MKTIIRKRPATNNLIKKSLSLTPAEYDVVNNGAIDSEIQVFDVDTDELVLTIPKKQYKKLTAVPRTKTSYEGHTAQFYVVDFSAVK